MPIDRSDPAAREYSKLAQKARDRAYVDLANAHPVEWERLVQWHRVQLGLPPKGTPGSASKAYVDRLVGKLVSQPTNQLSGCNHVETRKRGQVVTCNACGVAVAVLPKRK